MKNLFTKKKVLIAFSFLIIVFLCWPPAYYMPHKNKTFVNDDSVDGIAAGPIKQVPLWKVFLIEIKGE